MFVGGYVPTSADTEESIKGCQDTWSKVTGNCEPRGVSTATELASSRRAV